MYMVTVCPSMNKKGPGQYGFKMVCCLNACRKHDGTIVVVYAILRRLLGPMVSHMRNIMELVVELCYS